MAELGTALARSGHSLVYGGAQIGLMGDLADATLAAGGRVIGVMPQVLVDKEMAHRGLSELHIVNNMHERKAKMAELADAYIVAPGGFGTIEEAFEILTGRQIGVHAKPIVFLDIEAFWAQMEAFLQHAVSAGVLRASVYALWQREPDALAALRACEAQLVHGVGLPPAL